MKEPFRFLTSRIFLTNLAGAVVLFSILFWSVDHWLESYTRHGETITVPDYRGYKAWDLDSIVKARELRYEVIDSIYSRKADPGEVIKQKPEPGKKVKKGRRIYITINSLQPEMVKVPDLQNKSLRQARNILRIVGLETGELIYEEGPCTNCILGMEHAGESIETDRSLKNGTTIDLVVGKGLGEEKTPIPDLIGLTIEEAEERLRKDVLKVEARVYDEGCCPTKEDSATARVYKQRPEYKEKELTPLGTSFDLWLTHDEKKLKKAKTDSLNALSSGDSTRLD